MEKKGIGYVEGRRDRLLEFVKTCVKANGYFNVRDHFRQNPNVIERVTEMTDKAKNISYKTGQIYHDLNHLSRKGVIHSTKEGSLRFWFTGRRSKRLAPHLVSIDGLVNPSGERVVKLPSAFKLSPMHQDPIHQKIVVELEIRVKVV